MQTFLPVANFRTSAEVLDRARLGKQRLECQQIINALTVAEAGWKSHPCVAMWDGHVEALCHYMNAMIREWVARGYNNTMVVPWHKAGRTAPDPEGRETITNLPPWFGDEAFHASHRSNLLRKDPVHYGRFKWTEPHDLPYLWPKGLGAQS